jgi:30S ribosomal protein S31
MGKGDKKTRRGKINRASYGKNRKRKTKKTYKAGAKAS